MPFKTSKVKIFSSAEASRTQAQGGPSREQIVVWKTNWRRKSRGHPRIMACWASVRLPRSALKLQNSTTRLLPVWSKPWIPGLIHQAIMLRTQNRLPTVSLSFPPRASLFQPSSSEPPTNLNHMRPKQLLPRKVLPKHWCSRQTKSPNVFSVHTVQKFAGHATSCRLTS